MKKLILFLMIIFLNVGIANAKGLPNSFDNAFSETGLSKHVVSISIQDIDKPKKLYELNYEKPMMPASTQKLITAIPAIEVLGKDYKFSTKLYKNKNANEYYIVLGADPYLSRKDLKGLLSKIKLPKDKSISKLYIDDSIFDKNEWGEGWQWDDDLNPLMPKFSAYNIDGNVVKAKLTPLKDQPPQIEMNVFYPTLIMNYVKNGNKNDITVSRKNFISANELTFEGEIATEMEKVIPVNNMQEYFNLRLKECLKSNKLHYYGKFEAKKLPTSNMVLIGEVTHPISNATKDIYENSNNLVAETVFKLAGEKYTKKTGSFANSYKMIKDFAKNNVIDLSNIKIVDGSGVSKNNITTSKFMTEYLVQISKNYDYNEVIKILPTPNKEFGTLKNRMLFLENKLHAKTGTLTDVSALAGYIETKKGNKYAFSILINDAKSTKIEKKTFEELIVRAIYRNL